MKSFPFVFVARSAIAQRRATWREYDRARAQNRPMRNPTDDNDILLNLLAAQSKRERYWREIDSKTFLVAYSFLAKFLNPREALILAITCIIQQISYRFSGDRSSLFACPLTCGLEMVKKALEALKTDTEMTPHACFVFDLLRYGAAGQDLAACRRLSRRIKRQRILLHPVRAQYPHRIIIIERFRLSNRNPAKEQ